jgi:hypothetical protein
MFLIGTTGNWRDGHVAVSAAYASPGFVSSLAYVRSFASARLRRDPSRSEDVGPRSVSPAHAGAQTDRADPAGRPKWTPIAYTGHESLKRHCDELT